MLSQSISSFADILANFTNVCYVQVCFTMPLHISTVREPFTAGGTSVFHVDSLVSCTLGHNDHGVKDSGQGLCGQWCQREITRIDYCLWYTAWCCLKALLVLKLFWQTGHSMIMSTWVSQCLRMSFFDGIVFPHVEHVQLPSPKFWHIIESSMRLSSKYKQHHFKVRRSMPPKSNSRYFSNLWKSNWSYSRGNGLPPCDTGRNGWPGCFSTWNSSPGKCNRDARDPNGFQRASSNLS